MPPLRPSRRQILKSIGSSVLIPPITNLPISARAQTAPVPWATHFNNSTTIYNVGPIPTMPGLSPIGCITFNYRLSTSSFLSISLETQLPGCGNTYSGNSFIVFLHAPNVQLQLAGQLPNQNVCNSQPFRSFTTTTSPPIDDNYHNVIISWDGAGSTCKILIDGVPYQTNFVTNNVGSPSTDFGGKTTIGAVNGMDFTDFGLFAGPPFIDPATIIGALYDSESGYAIRNASNGSLIINGRQPQIWLSGPPVTLITNEAPGTFSWPATYNDTTPSSNFSVSTGSLSVATSDPFEPGSAT